MLLIQKKYQKNLIKSIVKKEQTKKIQKEEEPQSNQFDIKVIKRVNQDSP